MKVRKKQNILITRIRKGKSNSPGFYSLLFSLFLLPQLAFSQLTFDNWMAFRQTKAFSIDYSPIIKASRPNQNSLAFHYNQSSQARGFKTVSSSTSSALASVPSYLDFQELGWFCTLDLKLDQNMKLPLRFRLGSLDTVNRKEGYYD